MPEHTTENECKKWLIIVLIYADFTEPNNSPEGDTAKGINFMFADLLEATLDPAVCRLFVFMDSISAIKENDEVLIRRTAARYELNAISGCKGNHISECRVFEDEIIQPEKKRKLNPDKSNIFQDVDYLTAILETVNVDNHERIMLITWGHATGFGIFPFSKHVPEYRNAIQIEDKLSKLRSLRYFLDYAATNGKKTELTRAHWQQPANHFLENRHLAEAFSGWLSQCGKQRIDVLVMANCWMMNLHTLFAFRGVAHCVVAPQTTIGIATYNYAALLSFVNDPSTERTPAAVARHCIETRTSNIFRDKVVALQLGADSAIDDCTILAVDLLATNTQGENVFEKNLAALYEFFMAVHNLLQSGTYSEAIKYLVRYARAVTYDYGSANVYFADINQFIFLCGTMNQRLLVMCPPLSNVVEQYKKSLCNAGLIAAQAQKNNNSDTLQFTTVSAGDSLFFRLGPTDTVDHRVVGAVANDQLLNENLSIWKDILTQCFGV